MLCSAQAGDGTSRSSRSTRSFDAPRLDPCTVRQNMTPATDTAKPQIRQTERRAPTRSTGIGRCSGWLSDKLLSCENVLFWHSGGDEQRSEGPRLLKAPTNVLGRQLLRRCRRFYRPAGRSEPPSRAFTRYFTHAPCDASTDMPTFIVTFDVHPHGPCAWEIDAETEDRARVEAVLRFVVHPAWSKLYPAGLPPCTVRTVTQRERATERSPR